MFDLSDSGVTKCIISRNKTTRMEKDHDARTIRGNCRDSWGDLSDCISDLCCTTATSKHRDDSGRVQKLNCPTTHVRVVFAGGKSGYMEGILWAGFRRRERSAQQLVDRVFASQGTRMVSIQARGIGRSVLGQLFTSDTNRTFE